MKNLIKIQIISYTMLVLGFMISCSAPTTSSKTISVKRLTCTPSSCDKASLSLVIPSGYMQGEDGKDYLVGTQNASSTWTIYSAVELSDGSVAKDRDVRLYVINKQSGPIVSGNESDKITISWTPLSVIEEGDSNKMTVYVRDVDRCKFKNKKSSDKCTDMTKRMSEFEESQTLGFYVTEDEDLEAVSDRLNYIGTREVKDVSGALIKGCLLGALPGVLTGFVSGVAPGIFTAIKGCNENATKINEAL